MPHLYSCRNGYNPFSGGLDNVVFATGEKKRLLMRHIKKNCVTLQVRPPLSIVK